jgi:hypothetical protein
MSKHTAYLHATMKSATPIARNQGRTKDHALASVEVSAS